MKMFDITEVDAFELDLVELLKFAAKIGEVADVCVDREPLVANPRNPKSAEAIIAHELAARAERIVATVSRAPAR
jgi:hypothetical protein